MPVPPCSCNGELQDRQALVFWRCAKEKQRQPVVLLRSLPCLCTPLIICFLGSTRGSPLFVAGVLRRNPGHARTPRLLIPAQIVPMLQMEPKCQCSRRREWSKCPNGVNSPVCRAQYHGQFKGRLKTTNIRYDGYKVRSVLNRPRLAGIGIAFLYIISARDRPLSSSSTDKLLGLHSRSRSFPLSFAFFGSSRPAICFVFPACFWRFIVFYIPQRSSCFGHLQHRKALTDFAYSHCITYIRATQQCPHPLQPPSAINTFCISLHGWTVGSVVVVDGCETDNSLIICLYVPGGVPFASN